MRLSPVLMGPLEQRFLASACLPWHIEPENAKDPEQRRICKELTRIIENIPHFMQMRMWLLEAAYYGRSGAQMVYGWDFSKGTKRLCVKDWQPVSGDSLVGFWDKPGKWGLLIFKPYFGEGTVKRDTIPTPYGLATIIEPSERDCFVIHCHRQQAADYYRADQAAMYLGWGLRSVLYYYWYLMTETHKMLTSFISRFGAGFTIYYYERNNAESEANVRKAAESIDFENVIIWPRDAGERLPPIERIEPNATGVNNLLNLIEGYYGKKISLTILGNELTSESNATGLGGNLATVHENSFMRIVRYDTEALDGSLTRDLVWPLLRWNFPEANFLPRFKTALDRSDPYQTLQAAKLAYDMGVSFDENELRSATGFTAPDDDSHVIKQEAGSPLGHTAKPSGKIPADTPPGEEPKQDVKVFNSEEPDQFDAGPAPATIGTGSNVYVPGLTKIEDKKRKRKYSWKTIGGHKGKRGDHEGGTPVDLNAQGEIVKGPKHTIGKTPAQLKGTPWFGQDKPKQGRLPMKGKGPATKPTGKLPTKGTSGFTSFPQHEPKGEQGRLTEQPEETEPAPKAEESPTWQPGLFGGASSIAKQKPMFGSDQDKPEPKQEKDRQDLPGQQLLPGTEHNVPKASIAPPDREAPKPAPEQPKPQGQKRAKKGGEVGPNGEWYDGGAYIATTELPKMQRRKLERAATGREQIEPGKYEVPPAGKMSVYNALGPGTGLNPREMELNYKYLVDFHKTPEAEVKQMEDLLAKYKAGERYVDAKDYPDLMRHSDAARMALAGQPIPGAYLQRAAKIAKTTPEELEKSLGVKKYKPEGKKDKTPKPETMKGANRVTTAPRNPREERRKAGIERAKETRTANQDIEKQARKRISADAKDLGIKPAHVFQLAEHIHKEDREHADTINRMLKKAREIVKKDPDTFGSLSHLGHAFRGGDLTQIKGFDLLASQMRDAYPELFAGLNEGQEQEGRALQENESQATSADEKLYNLLSEGNRKPMSKERAAEKALDYLYERKRDEERNDPVPFRKKGKKNI